MASTMTTNGTDLQPTTRHHWRLPIALVGIATILLCLWPGDAPWIADEPMLIASALDNNANGTLATHGLKGTQGAFYGPLPTWIYQAYLGISHNLVALVALRTLLFAALTGAALLVIANLARLSAWGFLFALFSPFFWLYCRQIWDNSFAIPLAGWALAGYALFLAGRRWGIALCIACSGLLVLIHLMSAPLIAAIALHAIFTQRATLRQAIWQIAIPTLAALAAGAMYWPVLVRGLRSGVGLTIPSAESLLFTLSGGTWFGGPAFVRMVGQDWFDAAPGALQILTLILSLLVVLVPAGMVLSCAQLMRTSRSRAPRTTADHLAIVALLTLLLQFLYYGVRNALGHTHYFNASWIAYAFLIGLFCHWLSQWRPGRAAVQGLLACAAGALLALTVQIHRTGGTRALTFGPTLANQLAVARTLHELPPGSQITPAVPDIASIPIRIQVLMAMQGTPIPTQPAGAPQNAYIAYTSDRPTDGRIGVALEPRAK